MDFAAKRPRYLLRNAGQNGRNRIFSQPLRGFPIARQQCHAPSRAPTAVLLAAGNTCLGANFGKKTDVAATSSSEKALAFPGGDTHDGLQNTGQSPCHSGMAGRAGFLEPVAGLPVGSPREMYPFCNARHRAVDVMLGESHSGLVEHPLVRDDRSMDYEWVNFPETSQTWLRPIPCRA
jgi:hypothetical protein